MLQTKRWNRPVSRSARSLPMLGALLGLAMLCLTLPTLAEAQDHYGLAEVLTGRVTANARTNTQASVLKATPKGGVIRVRMPDTAGKVFGEYEFRWEFLDDISKIEPGKEYRFKMNGKRIAGTAERNTNTAWLRSANSGSKLAAEQFELKTPGRSIEVLADNKSIVGFPIGKKNTAVGSLKVVGSVADYSYFTFQFDFSSHPYAHNKSLQCSFEVAYLYRKNHVAAAPDAPNDSASLKCPSLYHLGVNIGILEYGTLTDANSAFMSGFIDHALTAAAAAGCIPADDIATLTGLKTRMAGTETSRGFANEVSAFRQHLARVVEEACVCEHADPAAGPNCPNLYGLGVNIGILEYGTLTDTNSTFMIGFLDHALTHAAAAGCIPPADIATLTGLKARIRQTETSAAFAAEVSAFRQHLARVVEEACNCNHGDTAATGKPNCPSLYHLGVNIGILEYGTLTDTNSAFMIGFIDHALTAAAAAGCIPAADIATLTNLKARIAGTETSGAFAAEVSAFRQHLARVVEEACTCDHDTAPHH